MAVRLLLLAALPLIAGAVWLDGQRYDPALVTFAASPGETLGALLPGQLDQLERDQNLATFDRNNLFELVNGHAEFFLSAGFKSAAVAGYRSRGGEGAKGPAVTVDLFDMDSPENAFGVVMAEGSGAPLVPVGDAGIDTGQAVLFAAGPYYIKVLSFDKGIAPRQVADKLADDLAAKPQVAGVARSAPFARFPEEGALPDGRGYTPNDYLGVAALQKVFEQRYRRGGKEFTAFYFKDPGGTVANLKKLFGEFGVAVDEKTLPGGGFILHEVADPYAPWRFVVAHGMVMGVAGLGAIEAGDFLAGEMVAIASSMKKEK